MKNRKKYLGLILICTMLGACSPKEDAADLYRQESPLQADITMPEDFSGSEPIKIALTQSGQSVDDADFVHVEIWKGDDSFHDQMEEAENAGDGNYTNNGSTIMPTLPFAVGELSKADIEALNDQTPDDSGNQESHH
jgi:YtkA-like